MQIERSTSFRAAAPEDGAQVWELIRQAGSLDVNSAYSYLMLCDYFRDTCVVAEENDNIVGFVSAFRAPHSDDTLFIWQLAVARSHRRKGLGKSMIQTLLAREASRIRYVEATIGLSNTASRQLFTSLAKHYHTRFEVETGYDSPLFPPESEHETENLFRIGPLSVEKS
ncbi:diaminobutyrate acetyltransferase [Paenibacillus xerothermodurans]|uniref:L-2,4-diaminobutyric acid acetyltransferase n=1 Tax=Paenibacillus xerothermodurans TaxID=1977292 RepID=A0A2W1N7S2_PAEXE|nr:diaminobutyrate acetyltransferase [Paenibacillus xerothermodurans]PZE19640.1 diaminobutyrate acetyltransferase [Paenibacillus xerothermodurans]